MKCKAQIETKLLNIRRAVNCLAMSIKRKAVVAPGAVNHAKIVISTSITRLKLNHLSQQRFCCTRAITGKMQASKI